MPKKRAHAIEGSPRAQKDTSWIFCQKSKDIPIRAAGSDDPIRVLSLYEKGGT
jgi:hypothetical protein